jgi:hypothetical protein
MDTRESVVSLRALRKQYRVYYGLPPKLTPKHLDYYSHLFPKEEYIKLEELRLRFNVKGQEIELFSIRYAQWLNIPARAVHALLFRFSTLKLVPNVTKANDHLLTL